MCPDYHNFVLTGSVRLFTLTDTSSVEDEKFSVIFSGYFKTVGGSRDPYWFIGHVLLTSEWNCLGGSEESTEQIF